MECTLLALVGFEPVAFNLQSSSEFRCKDLKHRRWLDCCGSGWATSFHSKQPCPIGWDACKAKAVGAERMGSRFSALLQVEQAASQSQTGLSTPGMPCHSSNSSIIVGLDSAFSHPRTDLKLLVVATAWNCKRRKSQTLASNAAKARILQREAHWLDFCLFWLLFCHDLTTFTS